MNRMVIVRRAWGSPAAVAVAGLVCAGTAMGCSLLLGLNEKQCRENSDCVTGGFTGRCVDFVCVEEDNGEQDGGGPDGTCETDNQCSGSTPRCMKGTCVSRAVADQWVCPEEEVSDEEVVHYSFYVVEYLSREPPGNMTVHACRNNVVDCSDPVATFVDTDGEGLAEFDLPKGFSGFFEVNSDALPSLLYVTKPIVNDAQNRDVPVLDLSTVQLTAAIAGFDFDPDKGLAILEALDCSGNPGGGVQFTESRGTADGFYIVDQVPSKEATVSVYNEVDNTADGGFINVEPGFVTFAAYLGVDGIELGTFNAQIRPSTITFIDMDFQ